MTRLETLSAYGKGFVCAGTNGFFAVFDRTDDRKEPYALLKSFSFSPAASASLQASGGASAAPSVPHWTALAVSPNDETLVGLSRDHTLYQFPLGNVDILDADDDAAFSDHFAHVAPGGLHYGAVLALDLCLHKPLVATVGVDGTVRTKHTPLQCSHRP